MPELPEVETALQTIKPHLLGATISQIIVHNPSLRIPVPDTIADQLEGAVFTELKRRAKYILAHTNRAVSLLLHLGMSGSITVHSHYRNHHEKHDHLVIRLHSDKEIVYNDPRRFGMVLPIITADLANHRLLNHLGVEPLSKDFTADYLYERLQRKKPPIKNALMDNRIVVGVGNIYACESLFRSHIAPIKQACSLTMHDLEILVIHIKNVLQEAIQSGGSSLRDYIDANGKSGYFQHYFAVYGKQGKPCDQCKTPIERIKQAGRSTFFCPYCQKNKGI